MALTEDSKKYWHPNQKVIDHLCHHVIKPSDKVLEIGPGTLHPFRRADVSIDLVENPGLNIIKCDVSHEKLPFEDNQFDFIYCRHLIEDLYNPFLLLDEMSRVGKAGYIETPSPIVEIGRGVDGGSPPFRGYIHHRWIVWDYSGRELRLVPKYGGYAEYLRFDDKRVDWLLLQEKYWNTWWIWQDRINWRHIQAPTDFNVYRDYTTVLEQAMEASRIASDVVFQAITSQKAEL